MTPLRQQLSLAACTLLATSTLAAQGSWETDVSHLSYRESDQRVSVSKTVASLARSNDVGSLKIGAVHDTMSGASPSGALAGESPPITVTGVSGTRDDSRDLSASDFSDTRRELSVAVERELNRRHVLGVGAVVSDESDHESHGLNLSLQRESASGLRTLTGAIGWIDDSIYRSDTGGTPEPLGNVQQPRPYSAGSRQTVDVLLGVSQVLNRRSIAQLNLSLNMGSGYHSDPYKIISAADEQGRIVANFHDSRPDSRLRGSLFGKLVHRVSGRQDSVHLSYRLYRDDWGLSSHTADLRYRLALGKRQYLEPHLRYYRQSQAEFFMPFLSVDDASHPILPENAHASADYRLDAMHSTTLGLKYGVTLKPDAKFRFRVEYLDQHFRQAVFDSNSAVIMQASFSLGF